ncbi:hypothetical protein F3Y22_tig00110187pilonHSYRG00337 [Hibiscus syriacus]|uniref:DUF7865 domain-containing protein n=1 Tax=Hibiscus syriacus TaxID=106335 RepID=A0A6A3BFW3_HIBSY|nr:hypothetical protein F3Y22_tig00110187pilonHSYRG00337 [Hibiscus syriacus]
MTSSSSAFRLICLLHSVIALTNGALMMFYMKEMYAFTHGIETATKLLGSTPHDHRFLLGLLLCAIRILLFMVSFVKE